MKRHKGGAMAMVGGWVPGCPYPEPGYRFRSGGLGRGLGRGMGRGPLGIPIGLKLKLFERAIGEDVRVPLNYSVQDEFKEPCRAAFRQAVEAMRFLVKWHHPGLLFQELYECVMHGKEVK